MDNKRCGLIGPIQVLFLIISATRVCANILTLDETLNSIYQRIYENTNENETQKIRPLITNFAST